MIVPTIDYSKYPKVIVKHDRNWYSPKGGQTTVYICIDDGVAVVGQARCSSKEMYNKRKGKSIALGRALRTIRLMTTAKETKKIGKSIPYKMIGIVEPEAFFRAYQGKQIK